MDIKINENRRISDMEKRLADKIKIGQLTQQLSELQMQLTLATFTIDRLLEENEILRNRLGDEDSMPGPFYPAYCNTGKEQNNEIK